VGCGRVQCECSCGRVDLDLGGFEIEKIDMFRKLSEMFNTGTVDSRSIDRQQHHVLMH
jgi:hypothetical protein